MGMHIRQYGKQSKNKPILMNLFTEPTHQ